MGLFRRGKAAPSPQDADEPVDAVGEAPQEADSADASSEPDAPATGPFDVSQVPGRGGRIDLGAVWLPGVPGMELRMEVDKKTQRVTGVACAVGGSVLQVQAFAAPRTAGIWDEIREEIAASVTAQGGQVDDLPGPFGRELLARLPVKGQGGKAGVRPARFLGVDGPRWFLRGVLTGKAAVEPAQARTLESVFAGIVVVRDANPRPPRDLLALTLPGRPQSAAPAPDSPNFDPLTRGPEITEIR